MTNPRAIPAHFQNTEFQVLAFFPLSPSFIWPWDMSLCKRGIVAHERVVLDQANFHPVIHLQLPRIHLLKPWLKLWPAQEKLRPEHVLAQQLSKIVDLQSLGYASRSMTNIHIPFLPSFLLPRTIPYIHDLSTCSSGSNKWL
jgi:hypothetical protein